MGLTLLLLITLPAIAAGAAIVHQDPSCVPSTYDPSARPNADDEVTPVSVGVFLLDLSKIHDVDQSFAADFHLRLMWKDPRLAHRSSTPGSRLCRLTLDQVWNPMARILNQRELSKEFPDMVEVEPDGTVIHRQRFHGSLSETLDLREFPFDRHVLRITIVSATYGPDQVSFVANERVNGRAETLSIPDWSIGSPTTGSSSLYIAPLSRDLTRFDYHLEATRHAGYYAMKVILPLVMIVVMSWLVFWIDSNKFFATQVSISMLSMLSLIAYLFALGNVLPRVSYLTRVDTFILGSLVLVFLALVQAVTAGAMAGHGREIAAQRLDRWSRLVFPALFLVLFAIAFLR